MLILFGLLKTVGRVSDFISNFLFVKIQRDKTSADFLAGFSRPLTRSSSNLGFPCTTLAF